jgi:membrane fusion protein, multidrug efflux system
MIFMATNSKRFFRKAFLRNIFFVLAGTGFYACGQKPGLEQQAAAPPAPQEVPVEVMDVQAREVPRQVTLTSNLEPWERQNIAANTPGRISRIFVTEGTRVQRGQLLVQMEDAQLQQARIQLSAAETQFRRMQNLYEAGAIPLQQLEQVRDQYTTAQTNHDLTLRNTQLRAPFAGVVTARHMNEGEIFTLSPTAAGAPGILTIQQLSPLKAMVNLSEFYFPQVAVDQPVVVRSDVYPNREFSGRVSSVFPVIDPGTRTFTVEIRIENPGEVLRPGMFARVNLHLGEGQGLMAPRSALIQQPGTQQTYGFVVENGTARRRSLETGANLDEWVEVTAGLNAGEQLVTTGQTRLQDGDPVRVTATFNGEGNL